MKASVLPNILFSSYKGLLTRGWRIYEYRPNLESTRLDCQNTTAKLAITDGGIGFDKFTCHWAVLCYHGYQGTSNMQRATSSYKKGKYQNILIFHTTFSDQLSYDMVIVENVLGSFTSLWSLFSPKILMKSQPWCCFFRFGLGLTILQIIWHYLCETDHHFFAQSRSSLYTVEDEVAKTWKPAQSKYSTNRALCLASHFFDSGKEKETDFHSEEND